MSSSPIIGIDLGTTNSLVAYFGDDGPALVPNVLGEFLTPSAVALGAGDQILVGQAAKDLLVSDPMRSTARFKRYMGTGHVTELGGKTFRAEELSALVLKSLKADAETFLGCRVDEAVISVPAYFNDIQRKATIAAAELAGLTVKRLLNEPTAAALAYGLHDKEGEGTFLVVDLGGGTFDVSIMEMFSGVMEVRASAGDAFLGGEDFTDVLVELLAQELGTATAKLSTSELSRLRALADEAKRKLSRQDRVDLRFAMEGREKELSVTTAGFEEAAAELIARLRAPIQRAMIDADLRGGDIARIVLVGGASRMPLVKSLVTRLFKRFPEFELDPDHVVGLGVAVQGALAARHQAVGDMVMTDVSPFTLGVETSKPVGDAGAVQQGYFSPILERNTVIPASRVERFHSVRPGQRVMELNIYQGEAPMVRDNVALGAMRVPIPDNGKGCEEVDVRFTYDNSGVLEVIATVVTSGKDFKLVIEGNPGVLSAAEIQARLAELNGLKIHPREDVENTALVARITKAYENALGDRRTFLSEMLKNFETALNRQIPKEIVGLRQRLHQELAALEENDVF